MTDRPPISAEEALQHTDWVRRLARALTEDAHGADDLAQDAWEAAAEHGDPLRGELGAWLTGVLRKLAAMGARTRTRRQRREAAVVHPEPAPRPDELLERLQTQQLLAKLVSELPEPVRLVLFLRYYEGLTAVEIGARLEIPAGTVRWRLKSGVDALRERLDESFEGQRARWLGLVVPLVPRAELVGDWLQRGLLMKANKWAVGLVAVLLSLTAILGWRLHLSAEPAVPSRSSVVPGSASALALSPAPSGGPDVSTQLPAWLAQPDVAARRIAGRVLFDGRPVSGARVRLEPEILPAGQRADERQTGADGAFDFGLRPALAHTVSASSPGRTGAVKRVDLRDPTAAADALELRLATCAARLVGHVLDSAGGPIEHARVRPARGSGAESNGLGEFELCVPPGQSSVHVDAEGYGPLSLEVVVFGCTSRDVVLTPEAVIVGKVVSMGTEAPVAGALVSAWPGYFTGGDSVRAVSALSGPDGRFHLPVAPGEFKVTATLGSASSGPPAMVTTIVGRLSDETVLQLQGPALLRGHVRRAGAPVAGARVAAISTAGGRRAEAYSQRDGSFVIQGAPRGEVMFSAAPFAVVSPKRVQLSKDEESVELEVRVQSAFHGVVTRSGQPVAGAAVKASAGMVDVEAHSDDEGRYALTGLRAGRYRLLASSEAAGGFVEKAGELLAEQEDRAVDLELSFAASIAGRVVAADGSPVPGAMVLYSHTETGDEGRSVTDADGRFRCQLMTGGGDYAPRVFPSPTARVPFAPAAGGAFKAVALADGSSHVEGVTIAINHEKKQLRGRTVDASGAPVPDVRLRAEVTRPGRPASFDSWAVLPTTVSDAQGGFSFDPIPGGPWTVHARSPAGEEAIVPDLAGGAEEVLIRLRPPAGIEGTLEGYTEPPAAIYARPWPAQDRLVSGQMNGTTFRLSLPAGTWLVSAMNSREGDVQRVEVKDGETSRLKMKSHGSARVVGSVVDYATGAPVADLVCHVVVARDGVAGATRWDLETAPRTDSTGAFSTDPSPAGELCVSCVGDWNELSTASALISVERGGQATVPLAVVRRVSPVNAGDLGLRFDDALMSPVTAVVPVIRAVRPGSPAAQAGISVGDVVVAMDGRPIAPLDASGVEMLIINHPPGSRLVLSVMRGRQRHDVPLISEKVQR